MNLSKLESRLKAQEAVKPAWNKIVCVNEGDPMQDEPGALTISWGRAAEARPYAWCRDEISGIEYYRYGIRASQGRCSIETRIRRERAKGKGILKIAKELGVGTSVVQRVLKAA